MRTLRYQADKAPQMTDRLNSTLKDSEKIMLEKQDLEIRLEKLEDEIASYKEDKKISEETTDLLKEKVRFTWLGFFIFLIS